MKSKKWVLIILIGILAGTSVFLTRRVSSYSPPAVDVVSNYAILVDQAQKPEAEAKPMTLEEAWQVATDYATNWSSDAGLIYLASTDARDLDVESLRGVEGPEATGGHQLDLLLSGEEFQYISELALGQDGRRRAWQATFTSEQVGAELHVEITDGLITYASKDGIHTPRPVITEAPSLDSPQALLQAFEMKPDLRMSIGKGRGFHFVLEVGRTGYSQIRVIGSHMQKEHLYPFFVSINQETGEKTLTDNKSYSVPVQSSTDTRLDP